MATATATATTTTDTWTEARRTGGSSGTTTSVSGSVVLREGQLTFQSGVYREESVAYGTYSDASEHASDFGQLRVRTSAEFPDRLQMEAAGFLEGYLTHKRVHDHFVNIMAWVRQQTPDFAPLMAWLEAQDEWACVNARGEFKDQAVWQQTGLVLAQFDGLVDGYNAAAPSDQKLNRTQLSMLNGLGDLLDLIPALHPQARPDWDAMSPEEIINQISFNGHCSALIKVNGDLSDLFFAHSSWFIYASMNRIYKHYYFAHRNENTKAQQTSFSSYPGVLSSLDDFYLMDSGLAMIQTTNSVMNMSLYDLVVPESLLAWQRVRVANQMASTGKEWAAVLDTYNSGTYNNQYMVLDLKLFTPGQPLPAELLTVVEQIPGIVVSADATETLERNYWPSYNVPYFREVYDRSGYNEMLTRHSARGKEYAEAVSGLDYQVAPRAKIFRRDVGAVNDLDSLKKIMRYNGWPDDSYSGGNPNGAICSRGDLSPTHPSAAGCYDTKVSSYGMAMRMESDAINGPTTQGQKPFSWKDPAFVNTTHEGMPDVFDFQFETQSPSWDEWEAKQGPLFASQSHRPIATS